MATATPSTPARKAKAAQPAAPTPVKAAKAVKAAQTAKTAKTAKTTPTPKAVKTEKSEKLEKAKKPKLVRDSFTIPKPEYVVLDALKQRAATLGAPAKKSELLRAGIKALAALPDAAFKTALAAVPAIKTGRPKKA